jgi:hypothetical protein
MREMQKRRVSLRRKGREKMICSTEIEKLTEKLAKIKMAATGGHKSFVLNAPGTTRTCDLLVRSQTLYPTELRAHLMNANCATRFTPMSTNHLLFQAPILD